MLWVKKALPAIFPETLCFLLRQACFCSDMISIPWSPGPHDRPSTIPYPHFLSSIHQTMQESLEYIILKKQVWYFHGSFVTVVIGIFTILWNSMGPYNFLECRISSFLCFYATKRSFKEKFEKHSSFCKE